MKRTISIAALCTILLFSCLLVSCKEPTLKYQKDGGFLNPKTDISYFPASPNYFSKPANDTPYARIKIDGGGADILLYEIEGIDPERYLIDNGYIIYAAAGAQLPTLYDLPCSRIGIYDTQVASNDGNITDEQTIFALKDLHKNGAFVDKDSIMPFIIDREMESQWYDLHFMADGAYKGIYYQLKYIVIANDLIVTDFLQRDDNGYIVDLYPGVPYETGEEEFEGNMYPVIRYNFGKEILYDTTTGHCYRVKNSLLPYFASTGE